MIASLPTNSPPVSKAPSNPKAPPHPAPPSSDPATATPADFQALMSKALVDLLDGGGSSKAGREKPAAKSSSPAKDAKAADPSATDAAANLAPEPPPKVPEVPPPAPRGPNHERPPSHPSSIPEIGALPSRPLPSSGKTASADHAAKLGPDESVAKTKPETAGKTGLKMDGMTVASSEERMKFAAEQNKIAGQAPKLPPAGSISSAAALKADSGAKARLPVAFSSRDNAAQPISIMDAGSTSSPAPTASASAVVATQAVAPVDRVEQLIAREAITFKSTGANEVGVTLKIDAHTQLFLQLSYRDGQTQAMLTWEKGDRSALNAHFGQLQESLARQNIQLQSATGGSDMDKRGASDRQPQEPAPDSWAKAAAKTTITRKPSTKPVSRQGWESWA